MDKNTLVGTLYVWVYVHSHFSTSEARHRQCFCLKILIYVCLYVQLTGLPDVELNVGKPALQKRKTA